MKRQLWMWHWVSGGWNHCYAHSKEEAIAIAKKKGQGVLIPLKVSVRPIEEVEHEMPG